MVAIVADDIVVLANYHCQNTLIHRETCRETKAIVLANELRDFLLELYVQIERSIEETAAGTA